jgi:hypothetical protein
MILRRLIAWFRRSQPLRSQKALLASDGAAFDLDEFERLLNSGKTEDLQKNRTCLKPAGKRPEQVVSTKSRQVIFGSRIRGAKIRAGGSRESHPRCRPRRSGSMVDPDGRLMVGQRNRLRRSGNDLNGGHGWLEVECHRCKTRASLPLDAIRRPRNTPIWKLEAALKCRSCKKGRYAPPVHMIKLTQEREITPYVWVHPDEER